MVSEKKFIIFDFDKTLIFQDSFRLFSLIAAQSLWQKILVFIFAVFCKLRFISNHRYKILVLNLVWGLKPKDQQQQILHEMYERLDQLRNHTVLEQLHKHLAQGDPVCIFSASPEFYLTPYVEKWSKAITVVGTKTQEQEGKFEIENLYGELKAIRAQSLIQQYQPQTIWVYTDHISDLPLARLADLTRLVSPSHQFKEHLQQLNIPFEIFYE